MIETQHLTKRYGTTVAVDGVSFDVQPGWVTGFVGPNGAGKSTTMRMILGPDAPSSGAVLVDGKPDHELTHPLRAVGALLEARAIVGGRGAANHLKWLADSNGIDRRRVDEVLDLVGLSDIAGTRVGTFSLGINQRLGIAAALLGDSETVMLDEPVNGLDPDGILWIRNLMKSLASGLWSRPIWPKPSPSISLSGIYIAAVLLGALAVRSVTAEYSTGMIRCTFTAMPGGRLVLAAKAATAAAVVFPVALVCNVVCFGLGRQLLTGKHLQVALSHPGVLQAIVFGAVAVTLVAIIGVGLGGVIRYTAGSTTALTLMIIGSVTLGERLLPATFRQYPPGTAFQATVTVHRSAGGVAARSRRHPCPRQEMRCRRRKRSRWEAQGRCPHPRRGIRWRRAVATTAR